MCEKADLKTMNPILWDIFFYGRQNRNSPKGVFQPFVCRIYVIIYLFLNMYTMEKKYHKFFSPHVGSNYHKGISGKKVLVLGASFYCTETSCPFFEICTSVINRDSSPFDRKCPSADPALSKEPSSAIKHLGNRRTYKKFANEMKQFTDARTREESWSHFAFTNYVRFFVPPKKTDPSFLTERDYYAFIEVLNELTPDIVIIWGGVVIADFIERATAHGVEVKPLEESEGYLTRIKLPDMDKKIMLINPYHPSSPHWYGKGHKNLKKFRKYFAKVLGE